MAELRESPAIIGTTNVLRGLVETAVAHDRHADIAREGGILAVNLYESADEYVVTSMLPGVSRKDVIISCDAHTITLVALVPDPVAPECGAGIWRLRELGSGPFARWIPFASAIVAERVQTRFADGLLTIRLPKAGRPADPTDESKRTVMG